MNGCVVCKRQPSPGKRLLRFALPLWSDELLCADCITWAMWAAYSPTWTMTAWKVVAR